MTMFDDPDNNPYAPPSLDDGLSKPNGYHLHRLAQQDRGLRICNITLIAALCTLVICWSVMMLLPPLRGTDVPLVKAVFIIGMLSFGAAAVMTLLCIGDTDLLAQQLHYPFLLRLLFGFFILIPGLNMITMGVLSRQASTVLRAAGYQPGWLGVDPHTVPLPTSDSPLSNRHDQSL